MSKLQKTEQGLTAFVALDDAFISIASRMYLIRNAKEKSIYNIIFGQMILLET